MASPQVKIKTYRFTSNYFKNGLGFKLSYEVETSDTANPSTFRIGACGGNFTTPSGFFTSPSYPDTYPKAADCTYSILVPNDTSILLKILMFDINSEDYLEIRDGMSEDSSLIGRFYGKNIPDFMQSTQNTLRLR